MQNNWSVTYEIVTPESAEYGDAEERGFLLENASFKDALSAFADGYPAHMAHAQYADSWPVDGSIRWFTTAPEQNFQTGAEETRALHMPEQITPSSRKRLARFLGLTTV